jgi:hypothetical protein
MLPCCHCAWSAEEAGFPQSTHTRNGRKGLAADPISRYHFLFSWRNFAIFRERNRNFLIFKCKFDFFFY